MNTQAVDTLMGYIDVNSINVRLLEQPSLLSNTVVFLSKKGRYGVTEKTGNFVKIEGGGYVYLDGSNVSYTGGA